MSLLKKLRVQLRPLWNRVPRRTFSSRDRDQLAAWSPMPGWKPWTVRPPVVFGDWPYDLLKMVIPPEEQPPIGLATITRARVLGRYCNVLDPRGRLYTSSSWFGPGYREMNMRVSLARWGLRRLEGRTLVLGSQWSGNYYHWLVDCLGKYALFLLCGGDPASVRHIILPRPPNAPVGRFLDVLGIDRAKIQWSEDARGYVTDEAVVPSYPGHQGITHPLLLRDLADRLRQAPAGSGYHPRLLVTRTHWQRKLINQDEVLRQLEPLGFRLYPLEQRIETQHDDFRHAKVIVAQQGSALTNLLFCEPGTRVVELYSPDHPHPSFLNLCQALGLHHTLVWGESDGYRIPQWNSPAFKSKLDVRVDLTLLNNAIGEREP